LTNNLTTTGTIYELVPLLPILCTVINIQFELLAVSQLHLGDIGCHFQSTCWTM